MAPRKTSTAAPTVGSTPGPSQRPRRAAASSRKKPIIEVSDGSDGSADSSGNESEPDENVGPQKQADEALPRRSTRTTRHSTAAAATRAIGKARNLPTAQAAAVRGRGGRAAASSAGGPALTAAIAAAAVATNENDNSSKESDGEVEEEEELEEEVDDDDDDEGRPAMTVHGRGSCKGTRPLVAPTATESRKRLFELLERRIGGVTAATDGGGGAGSSSNSRRMAYGELPVKNAAKKAKLLTDLKSQFDDWHSRLRSNFSVLLYGFGSKRNLLEEFARLLAGPRNRGDAAVLVFYGYNPRCTAREVVGGVATALMQRTFRSLGVPGGGGSSGTAAAAAVTVPSGGGGGAPAVLRALVEDIRREPRDRHAFVVIHNIDGPGLRGDVSLLSALAACPQVHVIASIDHALAPLLWDSADAARFRWQYINATTFQPYLGEISGAQSVLMSAFKSGVVTAGAGTVLRSLVLGAQEVFKVLAEHLLEDEECEGVAFAHLCRMCRERYLVRDERVLRQHLVEFVDHQLVRLRPASDDSGELLTIPMSRADIQAVLRDLKAARGE